VSLSLISEHGNVTCVGPPLSPLLEGGESDLWCGWTPNECLLV